MTTLRLIKSIGRSSSRLALLLIPLVFACFALSPKAQAVSPPPDGGYPGQNTAEGDNALFNLSPTDGGFNTAIGWLSLFSNTTGSFNTGVGAGTLWANTSHNNTAVGAGALSLNTTGDGNTANGAFALVTNTLGRGNTAVGASALAFNDADPTIKDKELRKNSGSGNTAVGAEALTNNTAGFGNTAVGVRALKFNQGEIKEEPPASSGNTAVGAEALTNNTEGTGNTAVGVQALFSNTEGLGNTGVGARALQKLTGDVTRTTAVGVDALANDTTGDTNTAVGARALFANTTGDDNTAVGIVALDNNKTGKRNIAVGQAAGSGIINADDTICIGSPGRNLSKSCFIGNIRDVTTQNADAIAVVIDSAGQLGTVSSSRRFKNEIKSMDKASEAILALKPVTFHYKTDKTATLQFGLIAEEVANVNPDLVARDKDGQIYTVRYDAVNAMLLNEFLKEHQKVQKLEAALAAVNERLKAQDAKIDKVNAKVELTKPAPQMVGTNQ